MHVVLLGGLVASALSCLECFCSLNAALLNFVVFLAGFGSLQLAEVLFGSSPKGLFGEQDCQDRL